MRTFIPVACLLSLAAAGLYGSAQDAAPKKGDNAPYPAVQKTDKNKDSKKDAPKETAKKFGKKGGKGFEDTSPPIAVKEPDLDAAALKELEKFQGEWKCRSMTRSGIALAKTDIERMHLNNEGRQSR